MWETKYTTFSKLMDEVQSLNNDITGKEKTDSLLEFYRYWGNYLDTLPAFMTYLIKPLGVLAKGLYLFTSALEHVFNNMFKLLGLFDYLGDNGTVIGQFYKAFQTLGVSIFVLLLLIRAITGIMGKSLKYADVIKHFMLVTLVVAVLPMAVTTIGGEMAKDVANIEQINSSRPDDPEHPDQGSTPISQVSLALQPLRNNVVDLNYLIGENFNTKTLKMDNAGFLEPTIIANNISDAPEERSKPSYVTNIDFGASYGAMDAALLDNLEKTPNGKGLKGLFLHKPNDNQDAINTVTEHRFMDGLNAFEPVYLRYRVNWLGMFAQYIALIVLLLMMSVKVVKSIFETVLTAIIAPIQGYTSVESSKKFKELLMTISGALAGIFFEIIIMRVTLEAMRDLPSLQLKAVSSLSGGFFDGLNMWERCVSAIIVYIGVFFGAMQGVTIIERWLGVSTGHSDTAQQVMGGLMMANAMGSGVKGVANTAMGAGGATLNGLKRAPGVIKGGISGTGKGIAGAGGGLAGIAQTVKEQGLQETAKAGIMNAANAFGNKVDGIVGGVVDSAKTTLDTTADTAYGATRNALNDNSPTKLPVQTAESLAAGANSDATAPRGDRNLGLQNREEVLPTNSVQSSNEPPLPPLEGDDSGGFPPSGEGNVLPIDEGGLASAQSPSEQLTPPAQSDTSTQDSVPSGGITPTTNSSTQQDVTVSTNKIPPKSNGGVSGVSKSSTTKAPTPSGGLRQAGRAPESSSLTGGVKPSQQQAGVKTPTTQSQHKAYFQKANQNFQQAKSNFDQGAQKMNGGLRSHIRGAEVDDD